MQLAGSRYRPGVAFHQRRFEFPALSGRHTDDLEWDEEGWPGRRAQVTRLRRPSSELDTSGGGGGAGFTSRFSSEFVCTYQQLGSFQNRLPYGTGRSYCRDGPERCSAETVGQYLLQFPFQASTIYRFQLRGDLFFGDTP